MEKVKFSQQSKWLYTTHLTVHLQGFLMAPPSFNGIDMRDDAASPWEQDGKHTPHKYYITYNIISQLGLIYT